MIKNLLFLPFFIALLPSNTHAQVILQELTSKNVIANASVSIYQRPTEVKNNIPLLKPLTSALFLKETYSDKNGVVNLSEFLDSKATVLYLQVKHPDYNEMNTTLLNSKTKTLWMTLKKESPQYKKLRDSILVAKSNNVQYEKIMNQHQHEFIDHSPVNLKSNCTRDDVPDYVWVKNLKDGYNGSGNGNGFTGYIHFEEYIAGVVQGEVSYANSLESKKAQAVAARTFSMRRHLNNLAVNLGQAFEFTQSASSIMASHETAKEVILYNNQIIDAKYTARCNGVFTQDAQEGVWAPYVDCSTSGNAIAYLKSVSCSHSDYDHCNQSGEEKCCEAPNARLNANGYIYGHGVGMCQRGMMRRGQVMGENYQQILNHYYTNICIANLNSDTLNCAYNTIELEEGETLQIYQSNSGNQITNHSCTELDDHYGPERLYEFTPEIQGNYNLTISNDSIDFAIYLLNNCFDSVCVDYSYNNTFELLNALRDSTYYFLVDELDSLGHSYEITIDYNPIDTTICSSLKSITQALYIDSVLTDSTSGATYDDGVASIFISGGTAPYDIQISSSHPTIDLVNQDSITIVNNLFADEYLLEITDQNGCTDLLVFEVFAKTNADTNTTNPTDTSNHQNHCDSLSISFITQNASHIDSSNGHIQAALNGSIPITETYSYLWSNQEFTSEIFDLPSDWYWVTVTTSESCVLIDSIFLQNDSTPTPSNCTHLSLSFLTQNTSHPDSSNGYIEASIAGRPANNEVFNYQWSNAKNSALISNLMPGLYHVTATSNLSCHLFDSVYVGSDSSEIINCELNTQFNVFHQTDTNLGAINSTAIGGTQPYSYLWLDHSNNVISSQPNLANLQANLYSLILTDQNNCSDTSFIDLLFLSPDSNHTDSNAAGNPTDSNSQNTLNTIEISDIPLIHFYPNPANGEININVSKSYSDLKLCIYNMLGERVGIYQLKEKNTRINTQNWSEGMYFASFTYDHNNTAITKKINIQH